jgi:hypothetical protein
LVPCLSQGLPLIVSVGNSFAGERERDHHVYNESYNESDGFLASRLSDIMADLYAGHDKITCEGFAAMIILAVRAKKHLCWNW